MKRAPMARLPLSLLLILGTVMSACNSTDNDRTRVGPQAVHPSPSALARNTSLAAEAQIDCHRHGTKDCHTHDADGSRPIID